MGQTLKINKFILLRVDQIDRKKERKKKRETERKKERKKELQFLYSTCRPDLVHIDEMKVLPDIPKSYRVMARIRKS